MLELNEISKDLIIDNSLCREVFLFVKDFLDNKKNDDLAESIINNDFLKRITYQNRLVFEPFFYDTKALYIIANNVKVNVININSLISCIDQITSNVKKQMKCIL